MMESMDEIVQDMVVIVMRRIMERVGVAGGGGSSNSGCGFLIWIIVGSAVGAYNELLGVIVLIVGAFILLMCR